MKIATLYPLCIDLEPDYPGSSCGFALINDPRITVSVGSWSYVHLHEYDLHLDGHDLLSKELLALLGDYAKKPLRQCSRLDDATYARVRRYVIEKVLAALAAQPEGFVGFLQEFAKAKEAEGRDAARAEIRKALGIPEEDV